MVFSKTKKSLHYLWSKGHYSLLFLLGGCNFSEKNYPEKKVVVKKSRKVVSNLHFKSRSSNLKNLEIVEPKLTLNTEGNSPTKEGSEIIIGSFWQNLEDKKILIKASNEFLTKFRINFANHDKFSILKMQKIKILIGPINAEKMPFIVNFLEKDEILFNVSGINFPGTINMFPDVEDQLDIVFKLIKNSNNTSFAIFTYNSVLGITAQKKILNFIGSRKNWSLQIITEIKNNPTPQIQTLFIEFKEKETSTLLIKLLLHQVIKKDTILILFGQIDKECLQNLQNTFPNVMGVCFDYPVIPFKKDPNLWERTSLRMMEAILTTRSQYKPSFWGKLD